MLAKKPPRPYAVGRVPRCRALFFPGGGMSLFWIIIMLAIYYDWRYRRIPNWLVLYTLPLIWGWHYYQGGWPELKGSLLGWLVGLGLLILPFLVGGMGAGDVKFLAAIGAWAGGKVALYTFLAGAILGGLWLCGRLLWQQGWAGFKQTWSKAGARLFVGLFTGQWWKEETSQTDPTAIPYAIPLSLGYLLVTLWLGR